MKTSPAAILSLAILAGMPLPAFAASSVGGVIIDYVTVGNPGNAPDPATGSLFGAVAYAYMIAKNETTIGQYAEFLNAVAKTDTYSLYNTNMGSDTPIAGISRSSSSGSFSYSVIPGSANKPITYTCWFDAARFCNWLHNGQGSGSTETGAYTLSGLMSGIVQKNADAKFWIPTENEWYKAAYYDPTKGGTGGYWLHANQSNALAGNTIGNANSANYNDGDDVGYPGMALTDVGAYGANSASYYGTNDQGGNVWEWNDAVMGSYRGARGGSWGNSEGYLPSSYRGRIEPASPRAEVRLTGFRVASVPEPSCAVLTILASGMLVTRRKR
jgi:formylglycine-generating enzyme required for sulfatase activity